MDFGIFKCLIFSTTSLFLSQAVVCILWMLHIKMGSTHNRDLSSKVKLLYDPVCHYVPKEREVKLPYSYRSTCVSMFFYVLN